MNSTKGSERENATIRAKLNEIVSHRSLSSFMGKPNSLKIKVWPVLIQVGLNVRLHGP